MTTPTTVPMEQIMTTMQQLIQQQALVLQAIADDGKSKMQLADTRGIGAPGNFNGDPVRYKDWLMKLNA